MLYNYPAIFYEEDNGQHAVIFPDLDGLSTCGDDFADAYNMAIDCLAGHLYYLIHDEKASFPNPSNIKDIDPKTYARSIDNEEYKDFIINIVSVDLEHYDHMEMMAHV